MKIGLAFRVFFAALFNAEKANRLDIALSGPSIVGDQTKLKNIASATPEQQLEQTVAPKAMIVDTSRNDALTLLSVLQREARFIDLVQEPLESYSDAQVGAAARDVLKLSKKALQRMIDIQPLCESSEGSSVPAPVNPSPARWKINGAPNQTSYKIVHPGWQAKSIQIPVWTGSGEEKMILAPTEIE